MSKQDVYCGTVEEIIYANDDNGYVIFDMESEQSDDGMITCVGCVPYLKVGETVRVCGKWVVHPSYGEQLKIENYERVEPETKESILQYLSSGIVRGIGRATANKIVERFGEETLRVIADTPERLAEIKGVSREKAMRIQESYLAVYDKEQLILYLQKHGVTPNFSMKIYEIFGPKSLSVIRENPYVLCERIRGVSFKTADALAQAEGYAKNSPHRIRAGIKYALTYMASAEGHTFLPREMLIAYASRALGCDLLETENCLVKLLSAHEVIAKRIDEKECVFLPALYYAEFSVADNLKEMLADNTREPVKNPQAIVSSLEEQLQMQLGEKQKEAVLMALQYGVCVITGGPGTGKTTTIRFIIRLFEEQKQKIALAAPTGRAAKRIGELSGREAKTIHRMLEVGYTDGDVLREYTRESDEPLEEDVVIVDEVSMVDAVLMSSLIGSLRTDGRLILVGDSDQLPSVGAGNVLADLIASDVIPVVCLDTVFRQAEESMIVVNAHRINEGDYPILNQKNQDFFFVSARTSHQTEETLIDLVSRRLPQAYGIDAVSDIQVITPMRKTALGVNALNAALQNVLNPQNAQKEQKQNGQRILRVGDKVMQIKNNYDTRWEKGKETGQGVYNGDMGRIVAVKNTGITVLFDDGKTVLYENAALDEIEHAYAVTVHKSQGSEFDTVVIPMFYGVEKLFTRNLLYTAVTRAKKRVILVGDVSAMQKMVENDYEAKRYSSLKWQLMQ